MSRRPMIAVIGNAGVRPGDDAYDRALDFGREAIDRGYRIVTGGLTGVMEAASRGAHSSAAYREGDTVGILPQIDPDQANEWVDIVIATGINHARNSVVPNADAVAAIGGGAGTLSEICFAWTYRRLIVALDVPGWSSKLGGLPLDERVRYADIPDDRIFSANTTIDALDIIDARLAQYSIRGRAFKK